MDGNENTNTSQDLQCYPCSLEEVQVKAQCFCVQCVEYLCTNCAKDHRKIKQTRSHVLLEDEEMPHDVSAFEEMAKLTFCMIHTGREIEFKCCSHNEFICSLCFRETHRKCDDVAPVNDFVPDKDVFKADYLEKHMNLKSSLAKQLQIYEDMSTEYDKGKIVSQIQSLSADLRNTVSELDTDRHTAENGTIDENKEKLNGLLAELNANLKLVDAVVKHGSDVQLSILCHSKTSNREFDSVEHELASSEKFLQGFAYPLTKQITKDLKDLKDDISRLKTNLSALKCLKLKTSDSVVAPSTNDTTLLSESANTANINNEDKDQNQTVSCNPTMLLASDMTDGVAECKEEDVAISSESVQLSLFDRTLTKSNSYDISIWKHSGETSTNIAAAIFDDENMVFVDRENKVMKLISGQFEVRAYITLRSTPSDLSLIKGNQITVVAGNAILIFSVCCSCLEIRQIREFKTKEIPWSVTPIGNELAILIPESEDHNEEAFVQVRSMENKILENIKSFADTGNRKTRMNDPHLIRKTKTDDFIIAEEGKVSIYERHGKMKKCYEPGYFTRLTFLAYDAEENIYVCDTVVDKVYQISPDLSKCRVVVSDLREPSCVVYNPVNKMLVVGCCDDNFVHTYNFT